MKTIYTLLLFTACFFGVKASGQTTPALTADPNATVDNSFDVSFTDDAAWRAAITAITVDGTPLQASDYLNTNPGKITINPAGAGVLHSPGTKNIVITATGYTDGTVSQTIDAGIPALLSVSTQPGAPGSSGGMLLPQPVVTAKDQYNNPVTGSYAIAAAVSSTQTGDWTLGGTTTVNTNSSGLAVFSSLTATNLTSGTYAANITFSYSSFSVNSSSFNIPTLTPPNLTAVSNATVDNAINISFADNASWRGAVTSVTCGATTLTVGTDYTVSSGQLALIPKLSNPLHIPGTYSITVTATGYSDATVSQAVSAGAPATLTVTTEPAGPSASGGVLSTQPVVTAKDKFGNLVTGSYTISATEASGQSGSWNLGGTTTANTNSSGVATFSNLTATNISQAPFNASITFTYNGGSGVTSNSFLIPAVAPTLTAESGATVDNTFAITFSENASWRGAITSITVDGTPLSTSAYSTTTAGQIIFDPSKDALLKSPGTKSIVINATNYSTTSVNQVIDAGAPSTLTITKQPTSPTTSGGQLATQPVITAKDKYNNLVTGSYAIVASETSGQETSWSLGGNTTANTNSSGVATFGNLTATNLTSNPYSATITFTCNGKTITSSSFTVPTLNPPSLTAAANATVDNPFDVTFADNGTWRSAITSITVDGTTLDASAYVTAFPGRINFKPANSVLLQSPGTKTIVIIAPGYSNATVNQTISAGAPFTLTVTTQPGAPASSGAALSTQPVITAKDKFDNLVSASYSIVAAVTSGQGSSWSLGGTKTVNTNGSGIATFTDLTATNTSPAPYNATITFTYNGGSAIASNSFLIPAVAPTLTAASGATVDNPFSITFTENASWRGAITSITVDGSTLPTAAYSTTSAGQIVFTPSASGLLKSPGTKAIVISATNYSSTSVNQTISAGVPTSLTITTQPASPTTSGGTLGTQPVITAKDQFGNLVSGSFPIVATVTSSEVGNWALGGTTTINTNSSGVATFTNLTATNQTSNPYSATITFSYNSVSVTSSSFTIPTLNPPSLTAAANATVDNPFSITFADNASWRGAITNITVDGTPLSNGAYSTTTGGQIVLNPANDVLLRSPGTKTIVITAPGYSNATVNQTVGTGVPFTLTVTTQPGAPASSGAVLSTQPVVTAKDKYGNLVTGGFAITAAVTSGQTSSWTLGGTTTANTNGSGVATFSNLTATNTSPAPFNGTITFTYNGGSAVASTTFLIPAVAPTLTAASGATVDNSFAVSFTDNASWRGAITGITVNGTNLVAGTDYTRSPGQITFIPAASNPLHTPGTYTIIVSATNYNDVSVSQTISAGVPFTLSVTTQPTSPSTSGGTLATQPVVTAKDKYGNLVSGSFAIAATVSSGQGTSWVLGGTTTVNTNSSGVATFTNLTATNQTSSPYTATITFTYSTVSTTSASFIIPTLPSPTLNPAAIATVDNPFNVSFTDNASWRGAIKSVSVGATTLALGTDYTISAGQITLIPTSANPFHTPGTYTITVAATGYSDATVSQTISAGVPATLTVTTQPAAPASSGAALATQPVITAKDKYGNLVTGSFAIVATVTGGQGGSWTLGGTTSANTNSSGVATFTNLTATNISPAPFNATITFNYNSATIASNSFLIPAVAPTLTAASGATVDNPFSITFTDNASWRGAITSITVDGTALPTAAYSTTTAGQIIFTPSASALLQNAGTKTIVVNATSYSSTTVSQTINAGAPFTLTVTTQPTSPATSGSTLATQPVITAKDKYGNLVSGSYAIVASVPTTQVGGWTLGGTTTVNTNSSGLATFTNLTATNQTSNPYTATITFTYSTTSVTSASFVIPTLLPPSLTAASNATVDNPFVITFTDNASWRGAITSITVNGTALPAAAYSTTSSGQIVFTPSASTLLQSSGAKTIVIIATGYSNATVPQTITAGAPLTLTITTQPTAPTTYNGPLVQQPVISAKDKYGNTVTGAYTITAAVTSGQNSSWTLGGTTGVATNSSGVATYTNLTATNLTLNNYGGATITFSYNSVTATSSAFVIPAPPPANDNCSGAITLTPATAPTAVSGIFLSATPSSGLSYDPTKADVWYVFTPTCTSLHTVTVNFSSGPNKDIDLDVFTGGSCPSSGTAIFTGHNNANNTSTETATGQFVAGTTYYVRVIDHGTTTASNFNISVTVNAPAQPSAITGNITPCLGSSENYTVSPVAGVNYAWVLPSGWSGSSNTNSIQAIVGSTADNITVTPSNACGLNGTSQTLTITPVTKPSNVSNVSVGAGNGKLAVSWTNPTSCYDQIMVVATNNSSVTLVPTGDGSLYVDTTEFASQVKNNGLNMNTGEYCIYKGTATSITITGLLNSNSYSIKVFTRWGTTWSSGVEVTNKIPIAVSTGKYKSVQSGNWTVNTTWQKWNGSTWVATSGNGDYPNTYNTDVSIEAGTVVLLDATPVSVNNLYVRSGGQLWAGDPDQSGKSAKFITVFGDTILCDGHLGKLQGNQADNISFNIEGASTVIIGSGTFGCAVIRKFYTSKTTGGHDNTNLDIKANVYLHLKGTDLYNGAVADKTNNTFNVTLYSPYNITLTFPTSDVAIDGIDGKDGKSYTGGTFTINGTLNIRGTLYLTTDNSSSAVACNFTIGSTGKVYTNKVESSASGAAKHTLLIKNGGLLNITDVGGFSNYSSTNNVINLETTSTVEYAATSTPQQVQSGLTYGNLTAMGAGEKIITTDFSNLTVSSNLGIRSGNTFNLNDRTVYLNGTVDGTGTITGTGKSNINVGPNGTSVTNPLGVLRFTTGRDSLNTLTMDRKMPANIYPSNTYYAAILGTSLKTFNLTLSQGILATDKNLLTLVTYPTNGYSTISPASYVATTDASATAFSVGNTFDGSYGFRILGVKAKKDTYFPVGADFISPNRMKVNLLNNAATRDLTVVLTKGDIGYTGSPHANRLWYVGSSVNDSVNAQVQLYYTGYDLASKPYMTKQDELETGFTGLRVRLIEKAVLSDKYFTNITNAPANVKVNGSPGTEVYAISNTADSVYNGTHPGIFKFNVFSIVDGDMVVLPVTFLSIRAYQQGGAIGINWSVANEINIDYYEVERAGDGRLFNKITSQQARNSGGAGGMYNATDNQPLSGTNYYRIKAIGKDGQVLYSTVVSVALNSDGKASLLVYPNPVKNGQCNVQLANLAAGTYNVGIYSMGGKLIALKQLEHAGGSSSLKLNLPAGTAAGIYVVKVFGQGVQMQTSVFVSGK